jgi:hypothetical protein
VTGRVRCDQNGPPARRDEGAYLRRYVTEEQRRRRPIFHRNPLGRCVFWLAALSLIGQRPPRVFSLFASRIQPKYATAPLHQSPTWCTSVCCDEPLTEGSDFRSGRITLRSGAIEAQQPRFPPPGSDPGSRYRAVECLPCRLSVLRWANLPVH